MAPDASASGPSAPSGPGGPRAVTRTEVITPEPAEALAGLLALEPSGPGGDLPPLWHWVYLLERRPQRDLGPDGHPTDRTGLAAHVWDARGVCTATATVQPLDPPPPEDGESWQRVR